MMVMLTFDEIAHEIHKTSVDKGFWSKVYKYAETTPEKKPIKDIDFMLSKLALIHSEVTEVLEAMRKQKDEREVVEEMADILIRLLDFYQGALNCGWVESSLNEVTAQKLNKNKERPPMHGNLA